MIWDISGNIKWVRRGKTLCSSWEGWAGVHKSDVRVNRSRDSLTGIGRIRSPRRLQHNWDTGPTRVALGRERVAKQCFILLRYSGLWCFCGWVWMAGSCLDFSIDWRTEIRSIVDATYIFRNHSTKPVFCLQYCPGSFLARIEDVQLSVKNATKNVVLQKTWRKVKASLWIEPERSRAVRTINVPPPSMEFGVNFRGEAIL